MIRLATISGGASTYWG